MIHRPFVFFIIIRIFPEIKLKNAREHEILELKKLV